ncbi:putative non-specific serine/threonine protein kinase [Helianthus anomalus]
MWLWQALAKDLPWKLKESRVLEILKALEDQDSVNWLHLSQSAFEKFDVDGDGYTTPKELRMGSIEPLMEEADIDKDGNICLSEFRRLLRTASMDSGIIT